MADKWDIPPWELPGGFRLDAKPHRGSLLRWLANAAFVCSIASFYPLGCFVVCCIVESWIVPLIPAIALGLLGWGLGLVVWTLARDDLEEMRTGLTNPEGKWETLFGRDRAFFSFVLGLGSFLLWGTCVLLHYLQNWGLI